MITIWLTFLGTVAVILGAIYGSGAQAWVAGAISICAGFAGLGIESAPPRGATPRLFAKKLRMSAALCAILTGALLLIWSGPPLLWPKQVAWTAAGFAAFWVLWVFLNRSRTGVRNLPLREGLGDLDRAAEDDGHGPGAWPLSVVDRMAIATLPIALLLYFFQTTSALVWAVLLSGALAVAGGVSMIVETSRRSKGKRLVNPRTSVLWIGLVWMLFGQLWVAAAKDDSSWQLLSWGWLMTGGGASMTVWIWRVRPILLWIADVQENRGVASGCGRA